MESQDSERNFLKVLDIIKSLVALCRIKYEKNSRKSIISNISEAILLTILYSIWLQHCLIAGGIEPVEGAATSDHRDCPFW